MQKLKDENYYVVHGWMINRLGLNGNDLLVFAIMYGFCQDARHEFKGSLNYITEFLGVKSKHTVIKAIDNLISKGYISKEMSEENGNKLTNVYTINFLKVDSAKNAPLVQEMHQGSAKNAPQSSAENALGGSAKNAPNNNIYKDNNKDIYKDKREKKNSRTKKIDYASSVRLTEEEYSNFVGEYGEPVVKEMINILNDYKEASGKTYKSDAAAIRKWVIRAYYEQANKPRTGKNDIVSAQQELARRLGEDGNNESIVDGTVWDVW